LSNIKELRQEFSNLVVRNRGLAASAGTERRDFTAEENQEFEKNSLRLKALESQIKVTEEAMDQERLLGAIMDRGSGLGRGGGSANYFAPGRFSSLGEFLTLVHEAGVPGHETDHRLYASGTGLGEQIPSEGGFLVESQTSYDLLQKTFAGGAILSRVRRFPVNMAANNLKLPVITETSRATGSRWGGIQVFRLEESGAATASLPKFGRLELNLKKIIGLAYVTDELLQDANLLETVVMEGFSQEFRFKVEDEIISGPGGAKMLGVLRSPCLITVDKEAGQLAKTVVYENIIGMWSRLAASSQQNAVWLINQDVLPQLFNMGITVGVAGAPVFFPAGGASGSPFNSIFGRPVIPVEYCETLGTKGDIILADFSQYLLAEKGGLQGTSSIHVRFLNDETAFRFVMRNDGLPIWPSALTPYKGTATVSPFITLAARA
jgi:HK97 family phage major capsid protein